MIRIYNTLTKQVEPFKTLEPGKVRMYTCGPTVYDVGVEFVELSEGDAAFLERLPQDLQHTAAELRHLIQKQGEPSLCDSRQVGVLVHPINPTRDVFRRLPLVRQPLCCRYQKTTSTAGWVTNGLPRLQPYHIHQQIYGHSRGEKLPLVRLNASPGERLIQFAENIGAASL